MKPEKEKKEITPILLLIFGVLLLLTAVAIIFVFDGIDSEVNDLKYVSVKLVLAISAALIVSQLPGTLKINLPVGITSSGAIGFAVLVFLVLPSESVNADEKVNSALGECSYPIVNIAILSSGNVDYTRNIKTSFLNSLHTLLPIKAKHCLNYSEYFGPRGPYDTITTRNAYQDEVYNIFKRDHYDYFVAIGTQAAIAFLDYFEENNIESKKLIFLGVTDPVETGLVNTIEGRNQTIILPKIRTTT